MADYPGLEGSPSRVAFLGVNSSVATPFSDGEFGLTYDTGEFVGAVPILDRLAVYQQNQQPLDFFQPFLDSHYSTSRCPILWPSQLREPTFRTDEGCGSSY